MRTRIRILAVLFIVLLVFPQAGRSGGSHPRVFDSVRPLSMVIVHDFTTGNELYRNICTVSSINRTLHLWLTAAHCVLQSEMSEDDDGTVITTPRLGLTIDGHLIFIVRLDPKADLAVLFTPNYSLPALHLAKQAPQWTNLVRIVGYPFGFQNVTIVDGTVSTPSQPFFDADFAPSYMLFTAQIAPGNSGSPVLNDHNEIISVAQIGWGRGYSSGGGSPYAALKTFAGEYFER